MFDNTRVPMSKASSYQELALCLDEQERALKVLPKCFLFGGTYVGPHVMRKTATCVAELNDHRQFPPEELSWELLKRYSADQEGFLDSVSVQSIPVVYELLRIEPVYWSMWACLLKGAFKKLYFPTSDVLGFLRQGLPKMLMMRDQYYERHGMNPCPYILLKQTWS